MVEVRYIGGLGNRLFQYCLGRIIAETLGFKLKADSIPGFPGTTQEVDGQAFPDAPIQELGGQVIDLQSILKDRSPRKIILHGYFQRYEYYQPFKDAIRKHWLVPDFFQPAQRSPDEIVLNIRRGDYVQMGWATPFNFFHEVLQSRHYERVTIVTDVPGDPFFNRFKAYKPVLFHKSPFEDFSMLLSFKNIVITQSTFSWWAAFLSEADQIIVPTAQNDLWSGNIKHLDVDMRINLEIFDEPRFKTVPTRSQYCPNLFEFVFNARHYRARLRTHFNFLRGRITRPLRKAV